MTAAVPFSFKKCALYLELFYQYSLLNEVSDENTAMSPDDLKSYLYLPKATVAKCKWNWLKLQTF